jgi:hypothetical protein
MGAAASAAPGAEGFFVGLVVALLVELLPRLLRPLELPRLSPLRMAFASPIDRPG